MSLRNKLAEWRAISIDLEATGTDPATARIIEIALCRQSSPIDPKRDRWSRLVNPGIPIPPEVTELTGITNEMVKDLPTFETIAADVGRTISGRPLIGFGIAQFDWPLLDMELSRYGVTPAWGPVIDVGAMFKILQPRDLKSAVKAYLGRDMTEGHRALGDSLDTLAVLEQMLDQHAADINAKMPEELAEYSNYGNCRADPAGKLFWKDGELHYAFGKVRGQPVLSDLGFASWMNRNDFPVSTLRILNEFIEVKTKAATQADSNIPY